MWMVRDWGRWLYLGVACFGHFANLAGSVIDTSPGWHFPDAIGDIASSLGGVLIGMAFWSPLAAAFRKRKQTNSLDRF